MTESDLSLLGLQYNNLGCYDRSWFGSGSPVISTNPSNNLPLGQVSTGDKKDFSRCISSMIEIKDRWALTPAPTRGGIVKQIGMKLEERKEALASLICREMGKIYSEALGEVQEFIDICDFAVGLSRTLPGSVLPSERKQHILLECWNPLGLVGIITAFNFPVAVYGWNIAISLVCGNCNIWKGSSTTCLTTIATFRIVADVLDMNGFAGVATLVTEPASEIAELICSDRRVALVSFTGSTSVGRLVSKAVYARFGKAILELGGNNASIILHDANIDMAVRACVFAAVGTCGQRCTSLRRLIITDTIFEQVVSRLVTAYKSIVDGKIGLPWEENTLVGPLHSELAYQNSFLYGLRIACQQGGKILFGGKRIKRNGIFVEPTIIEIDSSAEILLEELFCPILFVVKCKSLEEAIEINNAVPQGLSSSLFTHDLSSVFHWLGPRGSDCGIVNVNTSTSGAEIGGAFGGEKETGGGRESGSDSWKQYMRRVSCAINYSGTVPLAQGVHFDV